MPLPATTVPAPPLVWPNGQLMRPATLTRQIAAPQTMGVRSILTGHPAQGLTPQRLAGLLRQAEQGDAIAYLELAEEMEEKDLHYQSVLGTRKRQVAQLPINVIAAGESEEEKADAQLIRDWLDRDIIQAELFDMLDAVGKGFSALEIVWEFTSSAWTPARLEWTDQRFFEFDRVDGRTLKLRTLGPPEPLPAAKFIVHTHQAKSGIPIRGGLARAASWSYMFKNYAIKDWVAFLETYGMPLRVGRYDNGETEENIRTLMQALADLGSDAAAAFPKSMEVEFIDGKAGTAPNDLWKSKAEYCDDQVSKAVLGQTSSADAKAGGLGSGQANLHGDVRDDIRDHDAVLIAATLNAQLVVPMVMLNRGVRRRYPRLKIGHPDQVDVKAMVETVTALVPLGLDVAIDDVRKAAGLAAPAPGAKLLVIPGGAAAPIGGDASFTAAPADSIQKLALNGAQVQALAEMVAQVDSGALAPDRARVLIGIAFPAVSADQIEGLLRGAGGARGAVPAKIPGPAFLTPSMPSESANEPATSTRAIAAAVTSPAADPIDDAADEALGDWQRLMTPVLDPVRRLVDEAASLGQLRAALASVIDRMDVAELTEELARAGFGARLAGDVDGRGAE